MSITVEFDFREDMRKWLVAALASLDSPIDAATPLDRAAVLFFSVNRRRIVPVPRTVQVSRELAAKRLSPPMDEAVAEIRRRAQCGETLRPFLHKKIAKAHYSDGLLYDWGIHHLHIGSATPAVDGFVEQRDELLYAWVHDRDFLMLDVLGHAAFADDALVRIMFANWPRKMARFRILGLQPSPDPPSPEERRLARGRLTMFTQGPDGAIYMSPGGGVMSDGTSADALALADRLCDRVDKLERWLRTTGERELATWLVPLRDETRSSETLRLLIDENGHAMFEHVASGEVAGTRVDLFE